MKIQKATNVFIRKNGEIIHVYPISFHQYWHISFDRDYRNKLSQLWEIQSNQKPEDTAYRFICNFDDLKKYQGQTLRIITVEMSAFEDANPTCSFLIDENYYPGIYPIKGVRLTEKYGMFELFRSEGLVSGVSINNNDTVFSRFGKPCFEAIPDKVMTDFNNPDIAIFAFDAESDFDMELFYHPDDDIDNKVKIFELSY